MTELKGRVVAITGGARGIGLATAKALHAAGARVAIGDIDHDAAIASGLELGADVLAGQLDVTDRGSFERFVALVERELGPLDVLVNNAGIMPIGPFDEEPDALARRTFEINVLGCLIGMKITLPAMAARGAGQIVNVASVAGKAAVPGGITYAASKAAIVSATESARVEYAGRGIKFTCVMPSFTATELIAGTKGTKGIATVQPDAVGAAIARGIARGKKDVFVPGSVGAIVRTQPLLGRRLRDAINHALGADRTFLDIDQAARAAYDARISGAADQPRGAPEASSSERSPAIRSPSP
jgi:NAD(P)-dependent dehydrogenase (short-subunit alcohol dehydrogenase family)